MWPRNRSVDGVAGMRHFELTSGWSPTSAGARGAMAKADGVDGEAEKRSATDDNNHAEVEGMELDDDAALVQVLQEIRRAYCRLLSAADNDYNSINPETEFTRCFHSYDAESRLRNESSSQTSSASVGSSDEDLLRSKNTRDGSTSLSSLAATTSPNDVAVTSRTPPSGQPFRSATSPCAISSASRLDVFRPYQIADEKKLQAAMKPRQTPFDNRYAQSMSDRLRGGHCCSVPPFLRPIEEEDGVVAVGGHCGAETPADDNDGYHGNGGDAAAADDGDDDVVETSRIDITASNELSPNTSVKCIVDPAADNEVILSSFHDVVCPSGTRFPANRTSMEERLIPSSTSSAAQRYDDSANGRLSAISDTCTLSRSCFGVNEKSTSASEGTLSSRELYCSPSKGKDSATDCNFLSRFEETLFKYVLFASVVTFVACLTSLSPSCLVVGVAMISLIVYFSI